MIGPSTEDGKAPEMERRITEVMRNAVSLNRGAEDD
jgi:hypothetical protein